MLEYSDGGKFHTDGTWFRLETVGGGYLVRRYHYLETDPPLPLGQIAMILTRRVLAFPVSIDTSMANGSRLDNT